MRDLNRCVVPEIQAHWEDVAYALEFKIQDIEAIKVKHKEDPKKCCQEFLKLWLITDIGASPKNWVTLLNRIHEVQELAIVHEKVFEKL